MRKSFPFLAQHVPSPKSAASPKTAASPKSDSSQGKQKTPSDRSILVNKIVEGLRGDAVLLARDLGLETLSRPGGLAQLIETIRNHVFPRALEEGKELFRAGQQIGGPLSRQPSESMLSYVQRHRRWWNVLTELDPSMAVSESFRIELMLELSGVSRQEILVVKACRADGSFESTARVLIGHYSGIHLCEGSRSCTGKVKGTQLRESMGNHHKRGSPHHLNLARDTVSIDLPTWLTLKGKTRSGMNPRIGMRMMGMNQTSMSVYLEVLRNRKSLEAPIMTMNGLMVLMKRKQ